MSNLSLVEATLPPGFRFHPTDEELICDYLFNKQLRLIKRPDDDSNSSSSSSSSHHQHLLLEIDLNKCEPWDLPETACVGGKEWYFYSQRDRKYATGLRTNRATVSGYWKATGKDRSISRKKGIREVVGMRKTLVFYLGRAPKGKKTDWVMHEFRLQPPPPPHHHHVVDDWVLCRVFCKTREIVDVDDIDNSGKLQIVSTSKKKARHEEDTLLLSCCSSLPQLMEPPAAAANTNNYQLSFDNDNDNNYHYNRLQQVPCFSTILSNPPFDDHLINPPHYLFTPPTNVHSSSSSSSSSSHFCENKEAVKSILSRFHNSQCNFKDSTTTLLTTFGEGISDQSFLSDAALPVTMWYP